MRRARLLLAAMGLLAGCHRAKLEWPAELTRGVTDVVVTRDGRRAHAFVAADHLWHVDAPHVGEADPRSLNALLEVLAHPQLRSAERSGPRAPIATRVVLGSAQGSHTVEVEQVPLGAPVPLVLDGRLRFLGDPVELATKIPDPDDFVAPALWMSAEHHEQSLEVHGRASYVLRKRGEAWESSVPVTGHAELEDFAGAITGRQVVGFPPPGPPERLGLDRPALTAKLCTEASCRTFHFGEVARDGTIHVYVQAPGMDVAELRDDVWRLLLHGP